ncbi:uncharacterized protein METZ01_LOCUS197431 [marine metagenome]|uniref:Uncharacterized protein n=1 Tax=marine metagenome TaxID=408172 RepID=A0A382E3Y7_9ZZZZ
MKNFLIFFNFIFILFSNTAYALEKGKWIFVKDDEYCYIGSIPIETDLPKEKKRGDTYILVYKMVGNQDSVIQVEAGYNYKLNKDIIIKIDSTNYKFYTTEDVSDSAWTNDDAKVIFAMKKGLELSITGESSRGTITNDTYTLKGFTSAFDQLTKDC